MEDKKITCSMNELKPDEKHTAQDRMILCECSNCKHTITATAEFDDDGRLLKACFPINYCPNCKAEIERFVQYQFTGGGGLLN